MTLLSVAEDGEHGPPEQRVQPEDDRGDDADGHQHDHRVAGHRAAVGPVHLPELGHHLAAERADAAQPRTAGALLAVPLGLPVHCEGLLLTPRRRSIVEGCGRPGGTRTPNHRFWRPGLYQLSYWPLGVGAPSLSPKPNEYTTAQPAGDPVRRRPVRE